MMCLPKYVVMFKKIFFVVLILISTSVIAFSQVQNRVFLKGIVGNEIKLSQLSDTSIKLITTIDLHLKGHNATIFLTGAGYSQTAIVTISLNSRLVGIRDNLRAGTTIIIDDFIYKNSKTGATLFFKGSEYKVVKD